VKALRFYQKAVTTYIEGLSKYPKSFDLAYNKALLLYHITQEKRISSQVESLLSLLKEALDAHRLALSIDQENPDVLFNTAQVLTSFAEELNENTDSDPDVKSQSISLLQEAVELFAACLTRQEMEFTQLQEMQSVVDESTSNEVEQSQLQSKKAGSESGEQWAVVLEPITPDTLIETALAQLGSLSSLATVAAPTSSSLLANLSEIATPIVTQKLPSYISLLPTSVPEDALGNKSTPFLVVSASSSTFHPDQPQRPLNPQAEAKAEADLAVAVFKTALAGAEYQSKLASTEAYSNCTKEAFTRLVEATNSDDYPLAASIQILCAYEDALVEFADAIVGMDPAYSHPDSATHCWTALALAQDLLIKVTTKLSTEASAASEFDLPGKAQIYLQRGDIELLRSGLARLPSATASIANSLPTLLKNAGVYYRGAAGLAQQDGNEEIQNEAVVKAGVVKVAEGAWGGGVMLGVNDLFQGMNAETVQETVNTMVEERLIDEAIRGLIL
jgi:hypothetical protein